MAWWISVVGSLFGIGVAMAAWYLLNWYLNVKKLLAEHQKKQEAFENIDWRKALKEDARKKAMAEKKAKDRNNNNENEEEENEDDENFGEDEPELSATGTKEEYEELLESLRYNPVQTEAVERFQPIQQNTHCVFARKSLVWSTNNWDDKLSIDENVGRDVDMIRIFLKEGVRFNLDGFLIEVRGKQFVSDVESWGESVRQVLCAISSRNEGGYDCMKRSYIDKKGWYFEFAREPIFVTTFAPCYPSDNARFVFDAPQDSGFVLLQPEFSFIIHNIGMDTPKTNWENPQTVRDRIRVDFKKNGRMYDIPETIFYSPALGVVPPLKMNEPVVPW